ncbi:hypothetical protein C5D35_00985 [Rathayibacter toxicus]|nr:hypothetical protein C5D35_00985 [Rathayibacter toxicus]
MNDDTIDPYDFGLLQLISNLEDRLSPHEIAELKELVEHGEYQICLEDIIRSLESTGRPIPAEILNSLIEYSDGANLGEDACKGLIPE